MQHTAHARGVARRLALFLTALAAVLGFAAPAGAAPVTHVYPGGASITFSDTLSPGQKLRIDGAGFFGVGSTGAPVVFIKLDDEDKLTAWGGPSANYDFASTEPAAAFETGKGAPDGSFTGWVTLPENLPLTGGYKPGDKHWLRALSGAPFTTTGDRLTPPISLVAPFTTVNPITVGFQQNPAATFYPGTTVPSGGAALTVKGVGFDAGETATATFDGNPLTLTGATVDGEGSFTATFLAPNLGTAEGTHTVEFKTTNRTIPITLTYVRHQAELLTSSVKPGGTGLASVTGFVGIGGGSQRVAIITGGGPNTKIHGCGTTAADGKALIPFTVPADAAAGPLTFSAVAGAVPLESCPATLATPPTVVSPAPRPAFAMAPLTVAADAPVAGTTFTQGTVGVAFPVTGSGFVSGEPVTVKIDGVAVDFKTGNPPANVTVAADGTFAGTVTLPAATALGSRVITFEAGGKVAADTITAIAAPTYKVTTAPEAIKPGTKLEFAVTGFRRGFAREDGALGQKVGIRLDDGREVLTCVQTDDNGDGTGSIDLPATITAGDHTLRFLAGSSCVSGQSNDAPSRTFAVTFKVNELPKQDAPKQEDKPKQDTPPATTPPVVIDVQKATKVGKVKKDKFTLTLDAGQPTKLKLSVKTKTKQKVSAKSKKSKIVTIVKSTTVRPSAGKTKTVTVKLTADGRALLKRLGKLTVLVTIDPDGSGESTTTQFTLRLG